MTLDELHKERELIATLDECCDKCKHFGRGVNLNRQPSGQCQRNAPGKYSVTLVTELTFVGKVVSHRAESIESPFPGVWTWDKCGEFVRDEDKHRDLVRRAAAATSTRTTMSVSSLSICSLCNRMAREWAGGVWTGWADAKTPDDTATRCYGTHALICKACSDQALSPLTDTLEHEVQGTPREG